MIEAKIPHPLQRNKFLLKRITVNEKNANPNGILTNQVLSVSFDKTLTNEQWIPGINENFVNLLLEDDEKFEAGRILTKLTGTDIVCMEFEMLVSDGEPAYRVHVVNARLCHIFSSFDYSKSKTSKYKVEFRAADIKWLTLDEDNNPEYFNMVD